MTEEVTADDVKQLWCKQADTWRATLEDGQSVSCTMPFPLATRRYCYDAVPSTEMVNVAIFWAERRYDPGQTWWVIRGRHGKLVVKCEEYEA